MAALLKETIKDDILFEYTQALSEKDCDIREQTQRVICRLAREVLKSVAYYTTSSVEAGLEPDFCDRVQHHASRLE